jgi:ketosteroid isomerase-like protein
LGRDGEDRGMGAIENKQLLETGLSELEKGNPQPFRDSLAEDIRWTVIGDTSWSGTYRGKQAVLAELLGPLRSRLAQAIKLTAHRFIAEGDYVVVEARGQATTKAGKPYNNTYCWVCRVAEGKVRELTEYADTALIAAALGDRA